MKYGQLAVFALVACASSVDARKRGNRNRQQPQPQPQQVVQPPPVPDTTTTDRTTKAIQAGEALGNVVNAGATVVNKLNTPVSPETPVQRRQVEFRQRSVHDDDSLALRRFIERIQARGPNGQPPHPHPHQHHGHPHHLANITVTNSTEPVPSPDTKPLGTRRRSIGDDDILALRYLIERIQARGPNDQPPHPHPHQHHGHPHHLGNATVTNSTEPVPKPDTKPLGSRRRSVHDGDALALRHFIESIQARGPNGQPPHPHPHQHHGHPHHLANTTVTNSTEPVPKPDTKPLGTRRRSIDNDDILALRYLVERIQARGPNGQPPHPHPHQHHGHPHHLANTTVTNGTEPIPSPDKPAVRSFDDDSVLEARRGGAHGGGLGGGLQEYHALRRRQAIERILEAHRRSLDIDDILAARYLLKELKARSQLRTGAPSRRRSYEEQIDLRSYEDAVLNELD